MRRKLAERSGLTLVEMLAAVAVMALMGLVLTTGIQLALDSYHDMVAQSETELLLSTLADVLVDDLRYADDVKTDADDKLDSYTSDSYGEQVKLLVDDGKVYAHNDRGNKLRVLPDGAYGKGRYIVKTMDIEYKDGIFNLKLSVIEKNGTIEESTELSVRCLNP